MGNLPDDLVATHPGNLAPGRHGDLGAGAAMTSRRFSRKIMGAAYTRANGHCENCGVALSIGRIHYDHVKPWQTSRDSSLGNCACLCLPCHAIKTAVEAHDDARADR